MTDPIRCYHCGQLTHNGINGHADGCPVPELVALAVGGLVARRRATDDEQYAAIVAAARKAVARGVGHDCEEWRDARGVCELCDS